MIRITRKELYLNKIVGNDDYSVPEKPISEEEFFVAEILGEAVQAPEPLTRYQMYLAKIAGRNIEIPYPEVRLEYFLARAAGMEIEAPTPITREEMFWADYALIVEKELSGIPPLTFNAVAGTLKNYRIYGNTVNGESVGDLVTDSQSEHYGEYAIPITNNSEASNIYLDKPLRMVGDEAEYVDYATQKWHRVRKNLLQNTATSREINGVTFTVNSDGSITCNNTATASSILRIGIYLDAGVDYILSGCSITSAEVRIDLRKNSDVVVDKDGNYVVNGSFPRTFQLTESGYYDVCIRIAPGYTCDKLTFYPMIRKAGIEDSTYEPYIENTEVDVTLPAMPTLSGSNTLTVGTEVQPSEAYIKYEGAR